MRLKTNYTATVDLSVEEASPFEIELAINHPNLPAGTFAIYLSAYKANRLAAKLQELSIHSDIARFRRSDYDDELP